MYELKILTSLYRQQTLCRKYNRLCQVISNIYPSNNFRYYVVIQGISMILCLLFVVIYFPSRPQFAPTASAVTARLDIIQVNLCAISQVYAVFCIIHIYNDQNCILILPLECKGLTSLPIFQKEGLS